MSANGFASRSRPFRPGIHPAYLLACRVTSKTYPEAKCGQQQRILRILGLRSQSWGGSDLVSCIPSPAGDSTGLGRMDSEMAGDPGQFVCTGPAGLDDRVVSGGSLLAICAMFLAARDFFGSCPPADRLSNLATTASMNDSLPGNPARGVWPNGSAALIPPIRRQTARRRAAPGPRMVWNRRSASSTASHSGAALPITAR